MATPQEKKIRIVLRWVQILDRLEPFFKEKGEFRFTARVAVDNAAPVTTVLPEKGHYEISDNPAWNRFGMDKVIFEGPAHDRLVIQLEGEEMDFLSANDRLEDYHRAFQGDPASWIGVYSPDGEKPDPENMSNWRISYRIEPA